MGLHETAAVSLTYSVSLCMPTNKYSVILYVNCSSLLLTATTRTSRMPSFSDVIRSDASLVLFFFLSLTPPHDPWVPRSHILPDHPWLLMFFPTSPRLCCYLSRHFPCFSPTHVLSSPFPSHERASSPNRQQTLEEQSRPPPRFQRTLRPWCWCRSKRKSRVRARK